MRSSLVPRRWSSRPEPALPRGLRVVTYVAGVCGLLAAFWFPIFLFWLWAIAIGIWTLASKTHDVESRRDDVPAPLPVG